jgi:hypothetical protein
MNRAWRRAAGRQSEVGLDNLRVTARADLERICAAMTAMQAPMLPLFRALADGVIAAAFIRETETDWPGNLLAAFNRPALVIVSDDLEPARPSSPPTAWRCAAPLRGWARAAIAHGAGAEPGHYREAVAMALLTGRGALIETSSTFAIPWAEFLRPAMGVLTIYPRGGVHPVTPDRGTMQ